MQVNVHTDNSLERTEALAQHVQSVIETSLHRFHTQITRVEVHLSDINGQKGADAVNRCMMEARIEHLQPVAVSDQQPTLHQAINGAAEKLKRAIDSKIGRISDNKGREPIIVEPVIEEPGE